MNEPQPIHLPQTEPFRWQDVTVKNYKEEGPHFRGITRQVLAGEESGLPCQLRYFEIEPGGYSSLEKHQHVHVVMIVRGSGNALVGDSIIPLVIMDVVRVPPMTWHQFKAGAKEHLGFLCLVDCDRDKPMRPSPADLDELCRDPKIREFISL